MKAIRDLERLSDVTKTALTASQAKMQLLTAKESELQAQLAELARKSVDQARSISPATQAGADVRWQVWVDRRREDINVELARLRALKENARHQLRIAFGKDQAMQQLLTKQRALHLQKMKRQTS